jgi:hypothetical protein
MGNKLSHGVLAVKRIRRIIVNAVDLRYVGQAFQPAFRELAGWKACPTTHPTTLSQQH